MRYITLSNTDARVSTMCLGAMYFGSQIAEAQSFKLIDQFMEAGGNFIDTANNYAFWVDGYSGGESEQVVGRWMAERGNRDDVFLATKVGFNMPPRVPISLSRETIMTYCKQSLRNLKTDHIDLYYAHTDDRNTPLEETLGAFDELIQSGKVRYIACSNTLAWRIREARAISEQNGWTTYCALQQRYSYLQPRGHLLQYGNGHVPATAEVLDYATQNNLTIVAYSVLMGGMYSKAPYEIPEGYHPHFYEDDLAQRKITVLKTIAAETGATMNQVVLAWLIQNMPNMIALVSSSSQARLQENLDADGVTLNDSQLERLNSIQELIAQFPENG